MTRAGREMAEQGLCLESGNCPEVARGRKASRKVDSIHALVSGTRTERPNEVDTLTNRLHTFASQSRYLAGSPEVASDCARSACAAC